MRFSPSFSRLVMGTIMSIAFCISLSEVLSMSISDSSPMGRRILLSHAGIAPLLLLNNKQWALAETHRDQYPGALQPLKSYSEVGSWKPTTMTTKLGNEHILSSQISPLQQINPFVDQELYYAPFLFGAWNVTATLKSKKYPFGTDFVPSNSLIEGSPRNRNEKVGDTTSYEAHYFSTLANTRSNQLTVNLGLGIPKTKIIADRAFNVVSLSHAYKQLAPVQEVDWDYSKDPTKLTLNFGAGLLSEDMRPLGQRRGEVFLTARTSEDGFDSGSGTPTFCAAERSRLVTLAPGNVIVSDSETTTEFRKVSDDHITAVSRIAVYLTPNPNSREGVLWQQVGGKSVALFDYELEMKRLKDRFTMNDGSVMERACVRTPKDVVQCS